MLCVQCKYKQDLESGKTIGKCLCSQFSWRFTTNHLSSSLYPKDVKESDFSKIEHVPEQGS